MPDIAPAHLRAFLAVADFGSISQAARHLGVTQPAVSRSIMSLEGSVGSALLTRTSHGATLTRLGHEFRAHARRLIHAEQTFLSEIGQLGLGMSGIVRFGVDALAMSGIIKPVLNRAHRERPKLHFQVLSGGRNGALEGSLHRMSLEFIVARRRYFSEASGFDMQVIGDMPNAFMVRTRHPILKLAPGTRAEALTTYPLCSLPLSFSTRALLVVKYGVKNLEEIPIALESDSMPVLACFTSCNDAVLFAPPATCEREIEAGHLVVLDDVEPWVKSNEVVVATNPGTKLSPAAEYARDLVIQSALEPVALAAEITPTAIRTA